MADLTTTTASTDLLTCDQVAARAGRNDLPALLVDNLHRMPLAEIRRGVSAAWRMAEWPEPHLGTASWIALFDGCEYMVDGEPASRTDLPDVLTLYRGASAERMRGLSWTASLDQARWFANRFRQHLPVYEVQVFRSHVLARLTTRGEDEYIVDTLDLHDDEFVQLD